MKTTKEFQATHSMSTEWFVADEEGNIALFDFEEEGPVPVQVDESDSFGYMEDLGVPDEDGISFIELTDEQISDMLNHFKPISDFSKDDGYQCLVQIKNKDEYLDSFISLFKDNISCCLSKKERIYLVYMFFSCTLDDELTNRYVDMIKTLCTSFFQEIFDGDNLSSDTAYPVFCYKQPYNANVYLPERIVVPKHPLNENQLSEAKRKKLIHIPLKFSECTGFQIAQYAVSRWRCGYDGIEFDGKNYTEFPKTGGGYCYILENQDAKKDGEIPIVIDEEEK